MTVPTRTGAAKARRGGRRPGWALLTALLVLAIGSGIALVFTDKAIYLRIGLLLALWAAVIASFAALTYRRQSDTDQSKVRDQKLVYDLQLEREISARREYELTVESRLRQQLASEVEATAADEIATLRAELAALRTNLEILFDTDLGRRPALEHQQVRALGSWASRQPEPVEPVEAEFARPVHEPVPEPPSVAQGEYQDVVAEEEETRTSEYPIIDVPEVRINQIDEDSADTPAYPSPALYYGADQHEPEPYQRPASSGTHWRPQPESPPVPAVEGWPPPLPGPQPEPAAPEPEPARYWSGRAEDWDAVADGEDWDPVPQPIAPPAQPGPPPAAWSPPPPQPEWNLPPTSAAWNPAPAEGQWLPPGSAGSHWVPSQPDPPPTPFQTESAGRHSGAAAQHRVPPVPTPTSAPVPTPAPVPAPVPSAPQTAHESPGGHHAVEQGEQRGKRRADETGGFSVADLLGRLQADSAESGGGRRRRRED